MLDRIVSALHLQDLSLTALLDIVFLAVIIYQLLLMVRGTRTANVLIALGVVVLLHLVTRPGLIELSAIHAVLGKLLEYLPIAAIVLFQNQIRQALVNLGRNPLSSLLAPRFEDNLVEEIALAAVSLASRRLGALVVFERQMGLRTFYETGIALDARISYDLLLNVFTRHSPMHDGAVIIADGRIKAASCWLPLTVNPSLSRSLGTRHRAAIGITEESDAVALVISEERGEVALAVGGRISAALDAVGLREALRRELNPRGSAGGAALRNRGLVAAGPTDA
ncbi:MAG TPA: diadenylate cyclase CdaA [Candidatus Polarisedimenticolaceae bacterium]|nr:diadenylate cyclase CdaA [Candidatus Polarisedimenticolaceae bacterium]